MKDQTKNYWFMGNHLAYRDAFYCSEWTYESSNYSRLNQQIFLNE
jgi:hypothetical protein